MNKNEALQILLQSAQERIGCILRTNDAERLRQKLYQARKRAQEGGDTSLDDLQFRTSPFPEGQIVICKRRLRE
jgi:hypothetical protein